MKKIIIIFLISLLLIIIIALFIAPRIAKNYIVKNSPELIGRQLELDKLKVNYFRSSVSLTDLTLYEADGETAFVSFDHLYVNLAPWYLFSNELVIQELLLDGLKVNMIQYDSCMNIDDLIAYHTNNEAEKTDSIEMDTTESDPYKFHLSNLELKNGSFYYLDSAVGEDIDMVNLNLFVPYIGWNQEDTTAAGLKFFFANGGYFQSAFQMDPVTGKFGAEMTIDHLDLSTFYGYTTKFLTIDTLQGSLNTYLKAKGNTNFIDSISIEGWTNLSNLAITSGGGKEIASVEGLYCTIDKVQPMMNVFMIDSMQITRPYCSFELYDSTNTFSELLVEAMEEIDEELEEDSIASSLGGAVYPLYYSLNSFEIKDGSIDFSDNTYDSTFLYSLSNLKMAVDSISSDAAWLDATANMILNNRGSLIAEIGMDPNNPMDLDLQYAISEFRLSDLNIYTNHFIGHDIVFGDLYYTCDTKIRSGQIESENKLTIRDIEISKIEGGLMVMPLKFALFIIKDKNGDAVLDVPVRGDLNDPSLTIGKLVWKTFRGFIGKVAASPFHFLAGLVGADPSDLKDIKYDFADTSFTPKMQKQLDLMLELEEKKEGLDIKLVYFVDQDMEKEEIAINLAGEQFSKKTNTDFRDNESEFLNYLRDKANNDTINISDAALQLSDPEKLDSIAIQFSRYRVDKLQSYVIAKNDSTIIRVRSYHADTPMNVGTAPFFKVEYAIIGEDAD